MKRITYITLFTLIISIIAGTLVSSASWIGRVGISVFYKEYSFLKAWWKVATFMFLLLMLFYTLQSWAQKKLSVGAAKMVHIFCILAALTGLYLCYDDFQDDFSHSLLGERFHIGIYLFWIGWIVISAYLILTRNTQQTISPSRNSISKRSSSLR
ncbi:MAG TPA: hypothetical protein VL098_12960 [Flavipsychrobacter sp.]|nr:hypothetical protein [Flavipsychrobacter sp.]